MKSEIYPWQQSTWQQVVTHYLRAERMPHGLLIHGAKGLGKSVFASTLAQSLLCESPDENQLSCGRCKSCLLNQANSHPDLHFLLPEKEEGQIGVEQVRELTETLQMTRHIGAHKVAVIYMAERMNAYAANALLKTLEEPSEHSVLLLVTHQSQSLLPTIRSRCQDLAFAVPSSDVALDWLQKQDSSVDWQAILAVAQGAPLYARELADTDLMEQRQNFYRLVLGIAEQQQSSVAVAAELDPLPIEYVIAWVQSLILDLFRLKVTPTPISLENPDFCRPFLALAPRIEVRCLLRLWDYLIEQRRLYNISLNRRLFLENLLLFAEQNLFD